MKKKNLLYGLAILSVIALVAGVISYATEVRLTQTDFSTTPVEQTTASVTSTETGPAVKKKACGCCADRIARLQEQIRKARERRQAQQAAETIGVSQKTP